MAATAIPIDTLPSIDPATGEVLAHFERTSASRLPEIVSRARVAQSTWAELSIHDRCAKLRVLRERILVSRNELADAVVRESGKPRVEALFADIFVALDSAEYWSNNAASALRTKRVPHHSTAAKAKRGYLIYEPLGVIAIISSWNYPLAIPLSQIIPAGGKDAMIVLADADLAVASSAAVWGSYTNCGQVCLSVERLFVEQSISDSFAALCVEKTKKLRLGRGSDPTTDVGPLIRPQHVQRMSDLVQDAVSRGARILCGGNARPDLGPNFFEPTVIAGVDSSMKLFQEETFGPILAIQAVRDAEEAVSRANDSSFALSASVWTSNPGRGENIAKRLRAGAVMVNDTISYFGVAEAPHGGCGASGWGRTHGTAGLLEMVQMKYIDVDRLPRSAKPWWYRYGSDLEHAADAFLQFEFSGGIGAKLRNVRSALKTFFRDHGL